MRVLVTGGSGFVGGALSKALAAQADIAVRTTVRHAGRSKGQTDADVVVAELSPQTDWSEALAGVEVVVHTAARVHIMNDHAADPLAEFRVVNVEGTLNLARQAAAVGVSRFVFLSSVKVNGEETYPSRVAGSASRDDGGCFSEEDVPAPQDAYAISKMEAEEGLRGIAADTGMEVVIIRPPLVYGPGVRANFHALLRVVAYGLPLPFGLIANRRSLVALDNLVDFIVTCIQHPKAANQTFLVSDGEDVSTADLIRRLAHALGRPARLLPVPVWLLQAGAALLGKRHAAQRLCSSLQVDISKARQLLGWMPPLTLDEGLKKVSQGYVHKALI